MFMILNRIQSPNMSLNPGIKCFLQVCMSSTLGYLETHPPQKDQYHKERQEWFFFTWNVQIVSKDGISRMTESQDGLVWVGRGLKYHLVPTPPRRQSGFVNVRMASKQRLYKGI